MSRWLFVAIVVLSLGSMSPVHGQTADPRIGTWKLNLAKSKYHPGPPPKSQTLKFEPTTGGGFKMTTDAIPADGQPTHSMIEAKFDGKRYEVQGNQNAIARVYKRVNARTVESQDTANGKPSFKRTEVVSADGKTLTVTTTGPNAQGVVTNNLVVYDKQ